MNNVKKRFTQTQHVCKCVLAGQLFKTTKLVNYQFGMYCKR